MGGRQRLRGARAGGQRKREMDRQKNYGKRGVGEDGREDGRASGRRQGEGGRGWALASAEPHPLRNSTFLGESPTSSAGTEGKV